MNAADVLDRELPSSTWTRAFGVDATRAGGLLNETLRSSYRECRLTRNEFWSASRRALGLWAFKDDLEAIWIDGYRLTVYVEISGM